MAQDLPILLGELLLHRDLLLVQCELLLLPLDAFLLLLLRDAALSGRTEEALVRIMVPIPPSRGFTEAEWKARQASADELASRVAAELVPAVERSLPTWTTPAT
jgi:hypothetical protein